MNSSIETFFNHLGRWHDEYTALRQIVRETGLNEDWKWMHPCYDLDGKNVVLIHGFKDYCALLFMKGSLLADPKRLLVQQTPNVQARRQLRFISVEQIEAEAGIIKAYIEEAIELERTGVEVELKSTAEFEVPMEFQVRLDEDDRLREAFEALTPGRQRGYLLYFAAPKLAATREARVEKSLPAILDGLGLDD